MWLFSWRHRTLLYSRRNIPYQHSGLPFISQIHLAIVDFSSCNLDSVNHAKILIHGTMKLVSEIGFRSFLRPGSILAPPCLGILSAWCITLGMTRILSYERCILHYSRIHFEFHGIKLLLQLASNFLIYFAISKALSEFPYRGGIGNDFCCSQEHPEWNAISQFSFELLI